MLICKMLKDQFVSMEFRVVDIVECILYTIDIINPDKLYYRTYILLY